MDRIFKVIENKIDVLQTDKGYQFGRVMKSGNYQTFITKISSLTGVNVEFIDNHYDTIFDFYEQIFPESIPEPKPKTIKKKGVIIPETKKIKIEIPEKLPTQEELQNIELPQIASTNIENTLYNKIYDMNTGKIVELHLNIDSKKVV